MSHYFLKFLCIYNFLIEPVKKKNLPQENQRKIKKRLIISNLCAMKKNYPVSSTNALNLLYTIFMY